MKQQKITQKSIKELLARKDEIGIYAKMKGLIRIFQLQTEDEKRIEHTYYHNGVGFSGYDGDIMTSIANKFIKHGRISDKQYKVVDKNIRKYWKQLWKIAVGKIEVPSCDNMLPKTRPTKWIYKRNK